LVLKNGFVNCALRFCCAEYDRRSIHINEEQNMAQKKHTGWERKQKRLTQIKLAKRAAKPAVKKA